MVPNSGTDTDENIDRLLPKERVVSHSCTKYQLNGKEKEEKLKTGFTVSKINLFLDITLEGSITFTMLCVFKVMKTGKETSEKFYTE